MKVTVFGIGYVGLVQAAVLAEVGHEVLCIDVDAKKVENLKNGQIPIFEPGLTPLVQQNYEAGRLLFSTNAAEGVAHATVQFIAVGTPPDEDGSADLKYVTAVARTIAEHMTEPKVVIDKSTVPVGTADKVRAVMTEKLKERGVDIDFNVVSNPEFLKEGAAVADCMRPERIVIGTDNPDAIDPIRELYEPFNRNHDRMILMDIRSAELTKYAANCMLATKISFMNEMSNLAEMLGADIEKVRQGIGSDSRIGYHFIYPGCGYGGSCFPKDVQALIRTAEHIGYQPKLLQAVEQVNYQQKYKLPTFIQRHFGDDLKGKTFALWGLSFKPNTDDMREASSRVLMEQLWAAGAKIKAYDPEAMNETQRIYGQRDDLELMGTKESALQNADALIICTEWQNFRAPDFDAIKKALKEPVIFDGRNLYDPERLEKRGFTYYGIGRGASINPVL
ncbi:MULTISPECIES: UDP-glucose/GDP-mannose dehydrogenase family protein [Rahnella]|jgi:UDPglucose 6-dehydrogenase|uniref:UDP-glucose 6-dehydrogenase n=2 Tax=Rahnella TaxID=34037 RepID=A0A6M2AXT2_9GAMM|nr:MULTISPECIES: UDP-glucose/GDP-mannose dehydrogenase family protein [Rahnella]KAB8308870.1 UDP-glucose/GDP-mannose dehydrogenase family protein [Rouxiella chamberiensis]MBF7978251.1 UDP-glucose/GDP-mannose dehydrogenase family protein [Rahnella laticis]MBF7995475.1 UDP-glucose/GDP-mannose dehydrogenase family protein [Rahnella laticis]MBF7998032.1 UDP-glucose/GDP-mannose dehydrogenase family protein [Rahnella sp. LAC-M12]MBU9819626.1 UDP-glucose/GDP-mannose dehydrogenase family protein [Rahn